MVLRWLYQSYGSCLLGGVSQWNIRGESARDVLGVFATKKLQWISNDLKEEGLVINKHKAKYLFGEKELRNFNTTFWTVDEARFVHPRNKVQIPFIIVVFCWTGARIGAFFPDRHNQDKGGLRYKVSELQHIFGTLTKCDKDINVVLKRVPTGVYSSPSALSWMRY